MHAKAATVEFAGQPSRWCQACGCFESVTLFEGSHRQVQGLQGAGLISSQPLSPETLKQLAPPRLSARERERGSRHCVRQTTCELKEREAAWVMRRAGVEVARF